MQKWVSKFPENTQPRNGATMSQIYSNQSESQVHCPGNAIEKSQSKQKEITFNEKFLHVREKKLYLYKRLTLSISKCSYRLH